MTSTVGQTAHTPVELRDAIVQTVRTIVQAQHTSPVARIRVRQVVVQLAGTLPQAVELVNHVLLISRIQATDNPRQFLSFRVSTEGMQHINNWLHIRQCTLHLLQ